MAQEEIWSGTISSRLDLEHTFFCNLFCKTLASELGSKSGVMRGFQKGMTLWGRTSFDQVVDGTRGNMVWHNFTKIRLRSYFPDDLRMA